jgi:hypothetical protein
MNKRFLRVIATLAVTLLLPVSLGLPVYAEGSSGGSGTGSGSGSDSVDTNKTTTPTTAAVPKKEHTDEEKAKIAEVEKEHATEMETASVTKLKAKGKEVLDEAKKEGKVHTKDEKLKNCTDKKTGMETKVANIKSNSAKHLAKIDSVLVKLTESQAATPTNGVADLLAAATTAQATATASVSALSKLAPTIDCAKDTVASDIAIFKAAADQARTDLNAYRTAVKAVLSAIETANPTPATKEGN